jgi:hypothetical protein
VSTMSSADAWRTGRPADRSYPSGRMPRVDRDGRAERAPRRRPDVPPVPRSRVGDRPAPAGHADRRPSYESGEFAGPSRARVPGEPARDARRPGGDARRPAVPRGAGATPVGRRSGATDAGGSRLRGILAVLGVFLVTLAGAAIDSFFGAGLHTVTLVALVVSSALATLLVRRSDIFSVVVAPPLVFMTVALVNIVLAPSATFSLAAVATLLIRGFPAMGIATAVALLVGLFRLAARR